MKRTTVVATVVAVLAMAAGTAWAQQKGQFGRPVNKMCPMKPKSKAVATLVVRYKGKDIGFCCEDCVDKFKGNPRKWMAAVVEDADPFAPPENLLKDAKTALEAGKGGGYVVVLLFGDDKKASKMWNVLLTQPDVYKQLINTAFALHPYKSGDPLVKQFKVKKAPTLVIIDPRGEKPEILKTVTKGDSKSVAAALASANKKVLGE